MMLNVTCTPPARSQQILLAVQPQLDVTPFKPITLPLKWLCGNVQREFWCENHAVQYAHFYDATLTMSDEILCGSLIMPYHQDEWGNTVRTVYQQMIQINQVLNFPHLLRTWNYFPRITQQNEQQHADYYQQFCVGRGLAIPQKPTCGYPAATVIGIPDQNMPQTLYVQWLAAKQPGIALENPKQTSAWEYPQHYSATPPGFSRAMLLSWNDPKILLISGTASIVGHQTVGADIHTQLQETWLNIQSLITVAREQHISNMNVSGAAHLSAMRIYVRDLKDVPAITYWMHAYAPKTISYMILHGEICRPDLLVEIETVMVFE